MVGFSRDPKTGKGIKRINVEYVLK